MSSFNGDVGHEKKIETAKEKKEQADKAFQASDLPTGTSIRPFCSFVYHPVALLKCRFCSFEVLS